MKKLFVLLLLAAAFVSFSFTKKPSRKGHTKAVSRTLAFPVAGKRSDIEGFWGDSRDGGRRLHTGIDIYARNGTPVVAISDGVIVNKDNTHYGGKTLWLKPAGHNWTAYYAHLDRQLAKTGQRVRKGQVIGTVGNTGNAKHMPSHLHFGVEEGKGWVNPLPFVKHSKKITAAKTGKAKKARVIKRAMLRKRR